MHKVKLLKDFDQVLSTRPNGTPLSVTRHPAGAEVNLTDDQLAAAQKSGAVAPEKEAPARTGGETTTEAKSVKG